MFSVHLSLRVYFVYRSQFVQKFEFWFSLSDKSDSEGFIIVLIFFSLLIHVKKYFGGVGFAHHPTSHSILLQKKFKPEPEGVFPRIMFSWVSKP
jgi:hypothetical protein